MLAPYFRLLKNGVSSHDLVTYNMVYILCKCHNLIYIYVYEIDRNESDYTISYVKKTYFKGIQNTFSVENDVGAFTSFLALSLCLLLITYL